MKKILIATPVRSGVEPSYLNGLLGTLSTLKDFHFTIAVTPSTYVNTARNNMVETAKDNNCEEIIFIDADMVDWGAAQIKRLLSHDVDIVGGIYCKRKEGAPEWLLHYGLESKADANGLLEVNDIATGFLRIRMNVFDALFDMMPERRFRNPGESRVKCEYFPMGVLDGEMLGEDVYFCRMAQKAGFKIYADTHLIIRHMGSFAFPSDEWLIKATV
jgi:hypothetical protein